MTKKSSGQSRSLGASACAAACYHATTGALLGVVRLRLIEALPRAVGRHAVPLPSSGDAAESVRRDVIWRPREDLPSSLSRLGDELACVLALLPADDAGVHLLESLVAGTAKGLSEFSAAQGVDLVFVECYPWERPRFELVDALRAQAFHGKPIRADLARRYASEVGEAREAARMNVAC